MKKFRKHGSASIFKLINKLNMKWKGNLISGENSPGNVKY